MTWRELAMRACPDWPEEMADYALWNLSAYPFVSVRDTWRQLRHSYRLALRSGHLPEAPDGGFR